MIKKIVIGDAVLDKDLMVSVLDHVQTIQRNAESLDMDIDWETASLTEPKPTSWSWQDSYMDKIDQADNLPESPDQADREEIEL